MQTIRIGDPVPLVLAAAPTALAERGPMFSKKGRAMATPVPFKKVRRSIFRIFIGEVQELIGKRDAYDFSSMQKPRFKSRAMLLVRLMLKDIFGVIKMG